ncbi:MAG: tyrosine-protein phosphatase [Christensenella sp.]|uniref:tyrosine-protein phosphatase n=1 Tax=Christensenella sp. TaxID=1935934 RepID=UPI002B210821|nr:tyrosine-protein phosphatase [Christensenella sp.]MEA5002236.1 tyrosine-protein phosphatase [Christensenella sp.]
MSFISQPLSLSGAYNVRDLGGYPADEDKTTKCKSFLRADSLANLSADDRKFLYDYGVRLVIDLRAETETQRNPDAIDHQAMEYVNFPLLDNIQSSFLQGKMPSDMSEMYIRLIENSKTTFAAVLRKLAECEGCALYHCTAGKDRTGIITMLLLKLVGVSDDVIIADYSVTEEYMQPVFVQQKKMVQAAGIEVPDFVFQSKPTFMQKLMDYMKEHYKTVEKYLLQAGLNETVIEQLKHKLV